ncbi:MAG: hypothetical protein EBY41_04290 [Proteobacteria bacterium]|nr:hypothetical protein [Pseudomonadota bacterium]
MPSQNSSMPSQSQSQSQSMPDSPQNQSQQSQNSQGSNSNEASSQGSDASTSSSTNSNGSPDTLSIPGSVYESLEGLAGDPDLDSGFPSNPMGNGDASTSDSESNGGNEGEDDIQSGSESEGMVERSGSANNQGQSPAASEILGRIFGEVGQQGTTSNQNNQAGSAQDRFDRSLEEFDGVMGQEQQAMGNSGIQGPSGGQSGSTDMDGMAGSQSDEIVIAGGVIGEELETDQGSITESGQGNGDELEGYARVSAVEGCNDQDIVAQQLCEAATLEEDPFLRAALWREYNRYREILETQ